MNTEIFLFNDKIKFLNVEEVENKIINGDCLEVMKTFPDKSIDIIITSPPYNLLNSTGNGLKKIQSVESGKMPLSKMGIKITMTICHTLNI